jgi:GNAT superfamily N-acetyltransferase
MAADVRLTGPEDVPIVARSLARAFRDDPVFTWLIPDVDDDERARRSVGFFTLETKFRVKDATAWCSGERSGAALWAAPNQWRTPVVAGIRLAATIARHTRWRTPAALNALSTLEKQHPKEPHWYLAVLGTDPDHQGRGIGAALLAPVLERCDHDGLPSYLESSKESNIPYYERFGWRVTKELPLKGGPTLWAMWRDPS